MNTFSSYSHNKRAFLKAAGALSEEEQAHITQALALAEKYHARQKRDEVEPEGAGYVIHCVRVARWLLQQGCREVEVIIAALLHDALENTAMTPEEIGQSFGTEVLRLVLTVTRPRRAGELEAEKRFTKPAHFKKILASDRLVRLLKTADFLDNMRSWLHIRSDHPSRKKFPRWIDETKQYAIPIAASVSQEAAEEMKNILKTTL